MKQQLLIFAFLCTTAFTFSQNSFDDYLSEGVQYHDNAEYDKAIQSYEKALELDPESALANYEIALSYFSKGDYEQTVKYSDIVLKQDEAYMLQTYLAKGSALDMLGKTKESIKLFKKALKKEEEHYLLYYNLGLNYYKINNLEEAEEHVINAIALNSNHPSSHLILANIHNQKGNAVQTLLATHYFLFLEPNSARSKVAYQMLQNNFGGNVSKDETKPNTINIMLSPNNDSQFGAVELMISMLEASKSLEENEEKTDDEMFIENTESFFKVLGELKKNKNKEIWWTFYTTFFYDLAKSDHIATYCKYISQVSNENALNWLSENETKLDAFETWLKE